MANTYGHWFKATISFAVLLCAAVSANAAPPTLSWPVDCDPGVNCWVRKYVDLDPSKARRDFAGGRVTGDGHKGTDISLRHEGDIDRMVAVTAAAAGRVVGTRDRMPDQNILDHPDVSIKGKECGNGVRLDHGDGWTTQYCHLKRGSIAVKVKQMVAAGQKLGAIGLSGSTEFPHVHMTVAKNGVPVDPYNGASAKAVASQAPGSMANTLWDAATVKRLSYDVPVVIDLGLTGHVPNLKEARRGLLTGADVDANAAVIVGWLRAFGIVPGDKLRLKIRHQDQTLNDKTVIFKRSRLRYFLFVGSRRPAGGWPTGAYEIEVTLERERGRPGRVGVQRYLASTVVSE